MENIFFAIVLAILILGFYVLYSIKKNSLKFTKKQQIFFQNKWNGIIEEKNHTIAILEADKLLDLVLKKMNYQGSLGEKLKKAERLFSDINGVWYAHKLRNRLAHEIDTKISKQETEKALSAFHKALRDLKALH